MDKETALKILRELHDKALFSERTALETFIPELKENDESERIKKAIIDIIKSQKEQQCHIDSTIYDEMIAWLGKQSEQKPTDKIEPKFKIGDFIINDYCFGKVIEITNDAYLLDTGQGIPFSCEHNAHLWTIQDAKDGDVLQLGEVTAIFKEYIGNGNCRCYCSICNEEFEISVEDGEDDVYGCTNIKPATKKQRNLLFQKMKEDGYMWDAEKKELSPIKLKAGQVLKHDNLSILCLGGRNAIKCNGEPFVIQYPDEWIEVYGEEYDKFFTQLQSSGYYYDFLHNQVKENCSTLWIARDFDGALAVFTNKPVLTKSKNRWVDLTDKNDFFNVLPEYYYPKVTFENSPLQLFHL